MSPSARHDGWDLRESGSDDAKHTVLLLAGAMVTGASYEDLMNEPMLSEASIRVVAATLPGFGRTPYPNDLSVENLSRMATALAADLDADAVVGHSMGANIALEMAAGDGYTGSLVLVSPSFSRHDEPAFPRAFDRLASVFGHLPWSIAVALVDKAVKLDVTDERREQVVADFKNNDPRFLAKSYRAYIRYLDRHGSVVARLCGSGAKALVVFGEHDDVKLAEQERRGLERCPRVVLRTLPGAGHMVPMERPPMVAELIVETYASDGWVLKTAA
jgi:pimeloyl-ACP methyl ester carboxylesterase